MDRIHLAARNNITTILHVTTTRVNCTVHEGASESAPSTIVSQPSTLKEEVVPDIPSL